MEISKKSTRIKPQSILVRVKGSTLFPVHAKLTDSEVEFVKRHT
jgi:hypothetical protein